MNIKIILAFAMLIKLLKIDSKNLGVNGFFFFIYISHPEIIENKKPLIQNFNIGKPIAK